MSQASPPKEPTDKERRFQFMREYDARKAKRDERLFHWSLDMPPADDDMNVHVNRPINTGLSWKELAAGGAIALGGLHYFTDRPATITPPTPAPVTAPAPVPTFPDVLDSEYEVRFYDRNGKPIEVSPLQGK